MRDTRQQYRFRGGQRPDDDRRARIVRDTAVVSSRDGNATLYLYDVIDSWGGPWGISSTEFAAALEQIGDVNEITLRINSPGGEVYEGLAIMNLLKSHGATVNAVVDGLAASSASFIAASADTLEMGPGTELMIHDPWTISIGDAAEMRGIAARLDAVADNIASLYAAKADTGTDWRAAMVAETWYSPAEAVAAGLADSVTGSTPATDDDPNAFDLTVFKYQGRAAAPDPTARPVPTASTDASADARAHALRHRRNSLTV